MDLKQWIENALIENDYNNTPVYTMYNEGKELGLIKGKVSDFERTVRKIRNNLNPSKSQINEKSREKTEIVETDNSMELNATVKAIKTIDDLLTNCKVDLNIWNVDKSTVNKWEMGAIGKDGIAYTVPLFQVKAHLSKKIADKQSIPTIKPIHIEIGKYTPSVVKVDNGIEKTLIFSDGHIGFKRNQRTGKLTPMHDRNALDLLLKVCEQIKFNRIIIAGDMLDIAEASTFTKKPEFYFTLQPALIEFSTFLKKLRVINDGVEIVLMAGNHSKRIERSIIDNLLYAHGVTSATSNIPVMSIRNLLETDKMGIKVIEEYPEGEVWINDNLRVIHGEYTSVKKELETSKTSCIMGHLHRIETQSKTVKGRHGKNIVNVNSIGCLCKTDGLVPAHGSNMNWQQGFAVVESYKNITNIVQVSIVDSSAIVDGKVFTGVVDNDEMDKILQQALEA